MRLAVGPLVVTIKYTYPRGKTTIYQRPVPTKLRDRYPGKTIKVDLKTDDPIKVARMVAELNRKYEAEFAALEATPESSTESLKAHARKFLRTWELDAKDEHHDELALSLLNDHLDAKRAKHAAGDQVVYFDRRTDASEYLSAVEVEALRQLHSKAGDTITQALEVYLADHPKGNNKKFVLYTRRAFAALVAVTTDKELAKFTREDARRFIAKGLEEGLATGTIRRRINSYRAIWAVYCREKPAQLANPWESLRIPGEGEDEKAKTPFTRAELTTISAACRERDDDVRWIVAMMLETGPRIAEVVGATLDDIVLDAEVPYLIIQPHPWRSLKSNKKARKNFSARNVPLVGISLWAARRVKETAKEGQRFAFPRYTFETECKATHASNTVNDWLRSLPLAADHTSHDFRHTMADRLRAVQCPKDIRYRIDGHAAEDVGDSYGLGFDLSVKVHWLSKVVLPVPGVQMHPHSPAHPVQDSAASPSGSPSDEPK